MRIAAIENWMRDLLGKPRLIPTHPVDAPPLRLRWNVFSEVNSHPAVLRFSPVQATARGSLTLTVPEAARSARQPLGQVVWEGLTSIGAGIGVFEAVGVAAGLPSRIAALLGLAGGSAVWAWAHKKWKDPDD
jgi:hypothetical protein